MGGEVGSEERGDEVGVFEKGSGWDKKRVNGVEEGREEEIKKSRGVICREE